MEELFNGIKFNFLGIFNFLSAGIAMNKKPTWKSWHKVVVIGCFLLIAIILITNMYENFYTLKKITADSSSTFYKGSLHEKQLFYENGKVIIRNKYNHGNLISSEILNKNILELGNLLEDLSGKCRISQ